MHEGAQEKEGTSLQLGNIPGPFYSLQSVNHEGIFKMHNTKATIFFTLKIIGLLHSTGTSEVHDK